MSEEHMTPAAERTDFSIEDGIPVLTAAYHVKRGYGRGSGCRHCPYEPRRPTFHFIPTELSFMAKINHGLKTIADVLKRTPAEGHMNRGFHPRVRRRGKSLARP